MTTKIHTAVDGHGLPLAIVVTGGHPGDGAVLADVLADKAYSNGAAPSAPSSPGYTEQETHPLAAHALAAHSPPPAAQLPGVPGKSATVS